jgi:hypothetical protein
MEVGQSSTKISSPLVHPVQHRASLETFPPYQEPSHGPFLSTSGHATLVAHKPTNTHSGDIRGGLQVPVKGYEAGVGVRNTRSDGNAQKSAGRHYEGRNGPQQDGSNTSGDKMWYKKLLRLNKDRNTMRQRQVGDLTPDHGAQFRQLDDGFANPRQDNLGGPSHGGRAQPEKVDESLKSVLDDTSHEKVPSERAVDTLRADTKESLPQNTETPKPVTKKEKAKKESPSNGSCAKRAPDA